MIIRCKMCLKVRDGFHGLCYKCIQTLQQQS